jgi:dual specificity tyrosine-phosphorylation-regulated kinase 2/3/4
LESININKRNRRRVIKNSLNNKPIKKSVTNKRAYVISKDRTTRDKNYSNINRSNNRSNKRLYKIIKKNINQTNYNSNINKSISKNNNSLYLKENFYNRRINNSNSLGVVIDNHKNHKIRNIGSLNNNNILNGTAISNTFNNNIHRLNSSSKSKKKSIITDNKILMNNKRYDINKNNNQKRNSNNYINYANKVINKKEQKAINKSPAKNKQINIIMIHSNAKNNMNQNIITTSVNYNKEKESNLPSAVNNKKEMIKKIKINKYKNVSSQKKKIISNYYINNNYNYNGNYNGNNHNAKRSANMNKFNIIKKINNNYANNCNASKVIDLKANVKQKSNNLNDNNYKNNNSQAVTIKKSCSNKNCLKFLKNSISPKHNKFGSIDINRINNDSKILTSNNSCEELTYNKIVSIQKIKINKSNNNNNLQQNNNSKISDIINNNESEKMNSKNKKRKKIEDSFNNNKNLTTNLNKSFNIGNNINLINNKNNGIISNYSNNNIEFSNKTLITLEKVKKPKKIISISCSLKNTQNMKTKIKVHRRHQSVINQCPTSNRVKKCGYQSLSNNFNISLRNKINPQIINIDLQNETYIKNKNKFKNAKKFFNKEEPMSANKIINKYKNYLKEFELEELKHIHQKGELVYYLGEILQRIHNKENTYSKVNNSFILENKNLIKDISADNIDSNNTNNNENRTSKLWKKKTEEEDEEKIFYNRTSNNFRELKNENLISIKNRFDPNSFNDEEGDYIINIGTHLNYRYEIIECLGKGSFGEAIKCYDHKNKDLVCIKIINSQKKFQKQALIEIKILTEISTYDINNDTNNVKFYNYFIFRNHICLVFELLGINLYEYLQFNNFTGLDITQIKNYTTQILFSLLFLRNMNIIHCDLKPENILIFPKNPNQIKVIDFGSSCFENERIYLYIQSRFYRAPEVILDLGYNYEIDMWSLGCILYELYTGKPLFPGINEIEQFYLIMEKIGMPPLFIIESTPKARLFFDNHLRPFILKNEEGNIIKPGGAKIKDLIKDAPITFIDFINKCLLWNPYDRLTPDKALFHPFITENMSNPELYKHKLKVKHIKYGMQYSINSTRNKEYFDYFQYNCIKENSKNRDKSCETNSNIKQMPLKINHNEMKYTNTSCGKNEERKNNNEDNYYLIT